MFWLNKPILTTLNYFDKKGKMPFTPFLTKYINEILVWNLFWPYCMGHTWNNLSTNQFFFFIFFQTNQRAQRAQTLILFCLTKHCLHNINHFGRLVYSPCSRIYCGRVDYIFEWAQVKKKSWTINWNMLFNFRLYCITKSIIRFSPQTQYKEAVRYRASIYLLRYVF